jgi:hypothetical protein
MTLSDDPKRDGRIRELEKENERLQGEVTRWMNHAMTGEGVRERAMLALALGNPSPAPSPAPSPPSTTMRWYQVAAGWWLLFKSGVELPIAAVLDTNPMGTASAIVICGECGAECRQYPQDEGRWRCKACSELYGTVIHSMISVEVNGERITATKTESNSTVRDATHAVMKCIREGTTF